MDEVGCFDNDVALNIIKSELKTDNLDDIFEFDPLLPIASASIGQVYRAKLKKSNEYVAIKVQRPDAQRTATIDMYLIRTLASYIKQLKKFRSDLVGIADLFGNQLFNELGKLFDSILNWLRTRYQICFLDYIKEAKNCQLFKSLYGNGNVPGIYVPDVKVEYTTSKVLVMEYIEGVKGPWTANLDDGRRMLNIGLQCSVLQLLGTGFIHTGIRLHLIVFLFLFYLSVRSDPHRGNLLMVKPNSTNFTTVDRNLPKLAYLDFGMVSEGL